MTATNPRVSLPTLLGLALLALAGCGPREEIRTYTAPPQPTPPVARAEVRLLAAILPREDATWFLKLVGPQDEVARHEDAFLKVLRSVKFDDKGDDPISWTLPKGWTQQKGPAPRFATLEPEAGG